MLLATILKYTDKGHSDYSNLSTALTEVKKVNDWINEKKREQDNLRKIMEIEETLGPYARVEMPKVLIY